MALPSTMWRNRRSCSCDVSVDTCVDHQSDPHLIVLVLFTDDAAGADLRSLSINDSLDLTNAKTTIRELVIRWALGTNRA